MTPTDTDDARRDALAERLFDATIGTLEMYSVFLGWRLGLYTALAGGQATTVAELAAQEGLDPRYAQEWLEQQAVAGFLEVDDPAAPAPERRYHLPAAHAEVLADPEGPAFMAPFSGLVTGIGVALDDVVQAYRSGEGVPFRRYGAAMRDGQGAVNRPAFTHELAGWLAAVPDLHARLSAGDHPARIADLGCGQGWSTAALARAYPSATVVGIDLDEASIGDARALNATEAVSFVLGDASELVGSAPYNLVTIFEALHDMAQPADVLATVRSALAPDGVALVVDERVADTFTAPGDPVERMMYGWSVTHCLPASREQQPSAALGTVLRAPTVVDLGRAAGFSAVDVLAIDNDFFRFYLFRP